MVAIPELDGADRPDGVRRPRRLDRRACTGCERRCAFPSAERGRDMQVCSERAETLAARVAQLVELRRARARRTQGRASCCSTSRRTPATSGTAAYLSVFESLLQHAARR
jgi:magnesium chelatase subunit H